MYTYNTTAYNPNAYNTTTAGVQFNTPAPDRIVMHFTGGTNAGNAFQYDYRNWIQDDCRNWIKDTLTEHVAWDHFVYHKNDYASDEFDDGAPDEECSINDMLMDAAKAVEKDCA